MGNSDIKQKGERMKRILLLALAVLFLSSIGFSQQLFFSESGGYGNTRGYEEGSVRAPMASYNVNKPFMPNTIILISMTFEQIGTYPGAPVALEIGDTSSTPTSANRGQLVSIGQQVTGNNYTVFLGTSFRKGYVMTNSNYGFDLTADVPTSFVGNTLGFRLIGYQTMQTNGVRSNFTVNPSGILPFNIASAGSNGFAPIPLDLSFTLAFNGPQVDAFILQSTTSGSFSLMGYPTWWGPGSNSSPSSGGIIVGGSTQIRYQANNVPIGNYVGSQVIQGGEPLRVARTTRIAWTVQ